MKNKYRNSYSPISDIVDGHDWGAPPPGKARDWDGAKCKDCGLIASNVQIALQNLPECVSE